MSAQYDDYLTRHIDNVIKAYRWMEDRLPSYFEDMHTPMDWNILLHDESKYLPDEYYAYDKYFYGGNRSFAVVNDFNRAWLHHIHMNPHHWQHWVLMEDDPRNPENNYICIEMPRVYVFEMIADWWSFSWTSGDLYSVFTWYEDHKNTMKLHDKTKVIVEDILSSLRKELDKDRNDAEKENEERDKENATERD